MVVVTESDYYQLNTTLERATTPTNSLSIDKTDNAFYDFSGVVIQLTVTRQNVAT